MEPPARRPLRAHTRSPAAGAAISLIGRARGGGRARARTVPGPDCVRTSQFGLRRARQLLCVLCTQHHSFTSCRCSWYHSYLPLTVVSRSSASAASPSAHGARANCSCVRFAHSITQLYKLSLQLVPVLPLSAPTHTKANRLRNRTLSARGAARAHACARRWRPVRVSAHRSPLSVCQDQSQRGQSHANIGLSLTLAPDCEYDRTLKAATDHTNQRGKRRKSASRC